MANVLIVEDEGIVAMDIESTLRRMGHVALRAVPSGEQALAVVRDARPDVVLMDIHLRGAMDGVETARRIRELHDIPVIFLTAYGNEATVARARWTDPYAYLHKPVHERDLRTAIELAVHKHAAEAALRASQRQLATTLRSIDDAVVTADADGRITVFNPAAARLLGRSESEALGRGAAEVLVLLDEHTGEPLGWPPAPDARPMTALRPDGRRVAVEATVSPLMENGTVSGHVVALRDATEARRAAARAQLDSRMASLGTMTAAMAHEINNPLTYLLGNLVFARDLLAIRGARDGDAAVRRVLEALGHAADGAERIRSIVADLRDFARPRHEESRRVDLVTVARTAVRMTAHDLRHRARVECDLAPVPTVSGNESQLTQVVVNLLMNAAQAIAAGRADDNVVTVRTSVDAEARVCVAVTDTGCGIAPEHVSRIFEPFFTTRDVGAGMGMGLALAHGIVTVLGGTIEVESELGRGSRFTVRLPASAQPATAPPPPRPQPTGRRGRVLVVDDEPLVLDLFARVLEPHHEVVLCESGRAALERIESGEHFDAVVCDLLMPDTTGMDVYVRLTASRPAMARRVLFVTGGAGIGPAADFLGRVPNQRLAKPVDLDELLRVVGEVVDGAGSRVGAPSP